MTGAETPDPTPDKFNFLELAPGDPRNGPRPIIMISHGPRREASLPEPEAGTPDPEAGL